LRSAPHERHWAEEMKDYLGYDVHTITTPMYVNQDNPLFKEFVGALIETPIFKEGTQDIASDFIADMLVNEDLLDEPSPTHVVYCPVTKAYMLKNYDEYIAAVSNREASSRLKEGAATALFDFALTDYGYLERRGKIEALEAEVLSESLNNRSNRHGRFACA